jgi:neutral trehalase
MLGTSASTLSECTGRTQTKQLEEPEEDLRPRDRNGKLLSQAQISWGEMARFAESASIQQINERKNSDPQFRQFVETNLRREMLPAEDGIPQVKKTRVSQEVADFAFKYNREPIANLRPKGGFVTLAGEQIPWSQFQSLMAKAMAAGAI